MDVLYIIREPAVPPGWCLVIGAVLAPTDAVAAEGLLARVRLPPGLHETIIGESLFNDGAAVVVFVGGGWKWWGTDGFVGCGSVMLG